MKLRSGKKFFAAAGSPYKNAMMFHHKARSELYPNSDQRRAHVPDSKVLWSKPFPEYAPPDYTAPVVKSGPAWADPDISKMQKSAIPPMKFNQKDGLVNRVSYTKPYLLVDNIPQNPVGRTGLSGRGLLGRWGPNHAADPIVTRWSRDGSGKVIKYAKTKSQILQFVAILRKDSGEWAIPGGMVDAGEKVSLTLKREFGEEALNTLELPEKEKKQLEAKIAKLFATGKEIYSGYVDDPRNTDNAWMETVAVNFHDGDGTSVAKLPLEAGDDAGAVKWMDVSSNLKLYASHSEFLKRTAAFRKAHW